MSNALLLTNYTAKNVVESSQINTANSMTNALLSPNTSTATAAGTTILTNSTSFNQIFTGTTTQNVQLPDATTLYVGYIINIINQSTGSLTIKNNGSSTLYTVLSGTMISIQCTSIGSSNGTWSSVVQPLLLNNLISATLLPASTSTIAGAITGASGTFTGNPVSFGGSSGTYSGSYMLVNGWVFLIINISSSGGNIIATSGVSYISNLPFAPTSAFGTCVASDEDTGVGYGTGFISNASSGRIYVPTFSATHVVLTAMYISS